MVENEEVEDHTILDEYQRGYNFKGRLLRPAMVKVSVRK
jgi:molecular chaperone GrpE